MGKKLDSDQRRLWKDFCGFLDIDMTEYMYIQNRLFLEQIKIWSESGLGRSLIGDRKCESVEEFRHVMPLTTYEDYSNILLSRQKDMLPGEPVVWIQTTWEGGLRPIKIAPYTNEMIDVYRRNAIAIMILAGAKGEHDVKLRNDDTVLYGGAPLPFATGLVPSVLDSQYRFTWLPDSNENSALSFSQRIKKGFEMGYSKGIDYFFGLGSVANYVTESFMNGASSSEGKKKASLKIGMRYLRAKYNSAQENRQIMPKDVFSLKGFISTGTDAKCYKQKLADTWGVMPLEIAAGTESTCIGTETWEHNGMVFFPDACFYEFIHESEMLKSLDRKSYKPKTCLMNEVAVDNNYELVISVLKGGAFARYRIGDVYRCVSSPAGGKVPRFTFVDRVPNIIDIAGFTRITEASIKNIISISKLSIGDWFACKEFSDEGYPFLHMYAEMKDDALENEVLSMKVLHEHMTIYFKCFDSDYEDLKKLLNIDPLKITLLKTGTISRYEQANGKTLARINPSSVDVLSLLQSENESGFTAGGDEV